MMRSRFAGFGFGILAGRMLAIVLALAVFVGSPRQAEAAKVYFGTDEKLHEIQDIAQKGPNGEALYLGYKTSMHSFIAPYTLVDEGYILGIKGQQRYFKLDDEQIRKMQADRQLPSPLPPYEIDTFDWVIGHLAWIILAVLGLFGAWGAYKGGRAKKADAVIAASVGHAQAGRHDEAIAGFTQAIKLAPKNVMAFHNRAIAFTHSGQVDKAISDPTSVIRLVPQSADAFMMRAFANQQKGDHDRAITDFGSALRFEPNNANSYLGRSVSYRHKAAWPEALADCNKVIELAPDAEGAFTNRADTYATQGAADLAAADRAMAARLAQPPSAAPAPAGPPSSTEPPAFGPLTI